MHNEINFEEIANFLWVFFSFLNSSTIHTEFWRYFSKQNSLSEFLVKIIFNCFSYNENKCSSDSNLFIPYK